MMPPVSRSAQCFVAVLRNDFESFLRRALATLNPGMPFLPTGTSGPSPTSSSRVRRGEINRLIINHAAAASQVADGVRGLPRLRPGP